MNRTTINFQGKNCNVRLFRKKYRLAGHIFKHFLNGCEPWHTLENISFSYNTRTNARITIKQTGCSGEFHSHKTCRQFDLCAKYLSDFSDEYTAKIAEVLSETCESGAWMYFESKERCLFLSSEGVVVLLGLPGGRYRDYNVLTCFLPYDKRLKSQPDIKPFEQFFNSLDYINRRFFRRGICSGSSNPNLWANYMDAFHSRSQYS